jgi:hypothetical protein
LSYLFIVIVAGIDTIVRPKRSFLGSFRALLTVAMDCLTHRWRISVIVGLVRFVATGFGAAVSNGTSAGFANGGKSALDVGNRYCE